MAHIVIFKGLSQYDALRVFADHLAEGFQDAGATVDVLDLTAQDAMAQLQAIISQKKVDVFFTFNGVASDLKTGDGRSLYDALGTVFFSFYVDHPLVHIDRIKAGPQRSVISFIDKAHTQWAEAALDRKSYLKLLFIPHGGIRSGTPTGKAEKDFMFAGSFHAAPDFAWRQSDLGDTLIAVVDSVYDERKQNPEKPFRAVCTSVLHRLRLNVTPDIRDEIEKAAFHFINQQRIMENRRALLGAFAARGLPLDIYGPEGWNGYCAERPSFTYKGAVGMEDCAALAGQYKFVLNDNNDFQNGSHERVFNALLNASIPVLPKNEFYASLPATRDFGLFFDRASLNGLPETLEEFHAFYDGKADALVAESDAFEEAHSWRQRAGQVLEQVSGFF